MKTPQNKLCKKKNRPIVPKTRYEFLCWPILLKIWWFQHFKTHWHSIITSYIMGSFSFLMVDNAVSLLQKKSLYPPFLETKQLFAMKIENHHHKQLTPLESWDKGSLVEPGFGVSSNSNNEARILTTVWPTNQGEHLDRLISIIRGAFFFTN